MRVFVAGATGVLGRQLLPLLAAHGHQVVGMARHASAEVRSSPNVELVTADALDPSAVASAVRRAAPDGIVNLLTAIPAELNTRRMAEEFQLTNRLRTEGTRSLLAAAAANGVQRVLGEGLAYAYDPDGSGPADEDQPLWRDPPPEFAPVLKALIELEQQTREAGGLVLRVGHLYGPGTIYAPNGYFVRQVKARAVPLIHRSSATFSFTHVEDAATAMLAALDLDVSGVLNVVDDTPASIADWLPGLAALLDAPPPRHLPRPLVRLAIGGWGLAFLSRLRGANNARARRTLNWQPRYPSWRQGFEHDFPRHAAAAAKEISAHPGTRHDH